MAIIVGLVTVAQMRKILAAGYQPVAVSAVAGLLTEPANGDIPMAVWVDCETVDLLDLEGPAPEVTLRIAPDGRPLCPKDDYPLYAAVDNCYSHIIPAWSGDKGAYSGFDADTAEADHRESELTCLYCACGWQVDPRRTRVEVDETEPEVAHA